MATETKDQLALDERQIDDKTLEGLLEARLTAAQGKAEVTGVFKKAHQAASAAVALLGLADDDAVRVGRFRITSKSIPGGHREFDTQARTQVWFGLVEDEPAATKPATRGRGKLAAVPDPDADVRPTGDVNAAALRGEAERSVTPEGDGPVH